MENPPYSGQCLCGAIQYEVDELQPNMAHCHCSMCRKFHGAAFSTFGEAKKEHFRWTAGEDKLSQFIAPNGTTRQFCRICGSSLTFTPNVDNFAYVEFSLGTLDSALTEIPDAHVYVGSMANWDRIDDELPKFNEGRDSEQV